MIKQEDMDQMLELMKQPEVERLVHKLENMNTATRSFFIRELLASTSNDDDQLLKDVCYILGDFIVILAEFDQKETGKMLGVILQYLAKVCDRRIELRNKDIH